MEHFLAPEGTPPIDVPYVCKEEYDGGSFMDYPGRKKWKEEELNGFKFFGKRSQSDVESFFQTWLYFGALQSIFNIVGVTVTTGDFIRLNSSKQKLITTEKLPGFMGAWMNREGMKNESLNEKLAPEFKLDYAWLKDREKRGKEIEAILRRLHSFAYKYCSVEGQEEEIAAARQPQFWPISTRIGMAILAIGAPLFRVAAEIYGFEVQHLPNWGSSPFLNERLRNAGWCIRDIPTFRETNAIDCDYYFGSVTSPRATLDHTGCTKVICCAKNVDVAEYVTAHAPVCDDLGQKFIYAPPNMYDIVRKGGLPIMRWKDGKLTCYEYDPKSMTRFVAISHVWSDGMGNETENALPICQLNKIQTMVAEIYTKQHISSARRYHPSYVLRGKSEDPTLIWWDGYTWDEALPVVPKEEVDVGFWMDTLCVPREEELRDQVISQMRYIYQYAHRVLVIDSTILDLSIEADLTTKFFRLYLSNYLRRLWTLQEAVVARSLIFQLKDGALTARELSDQISDYDSVKHLYSEMVGNCSDPFDTLFDFYVFTDAKADEITPDIAFAPFADAIQHRSTKKASDETICFATILRINADPLTKVSKEKRMEKFFELLGAVDPTIIFNSFPRLETHGFRWAPRSFIGQGYELSTIPNGRSWAVERGNAKVIPGGGLHVSFPGADLDPRTIGSHLANVFYFTDDITSPTWYLVRLQPDIDGNYPEWQKNTHYAIISFEELKEDSPDSEAILGIVESKLETSDKMVSPADPEDESTRITISSICRAKISVPNQTQMKRLKALTASHLEGATKLTQSTKKLMQTSKLVNMGAKMVTGYVNLLAKTTEMLGGVSFDGTYVAQGSILKVDQKWCVM